ncbi:MAG: 50S ribosomal protein L9 [Gammaproteobacteria bacterium]|jgi:large subunit ribosomal protein L9|nr:50S ribosomal protein L9 [Gammaproteobacteria bacterium]
MEVILLEKTGRLGNIGDRINVKAGYGRNYLIPQGKAVFATPGNIARFEQQRAELERISAQRLQDAQALAAQIERVSAVTITAVAGEGGKLFGSVGARDIADVLVAAGVNVAKSAVKLPAGAIRDLGQFTVDIQVHADVTQSVTVNVTAA